LREQGEVDAVPVVRGAQGVGPSRPDARGHSAPGVACPPHGVGGLVEPSGVAGLCTTKSEASSPLSVQLPAGPPGLRAVLAAASLARLAVLSCGRLLTGVPAQVKVPSNAAFVATLYA